MLNYRHGQNNLETGSELIIETGKKDVDITMLAERALVPRAAIYVTFGKNPKVAIFRQILASVPYIRPKINRCGFSDQ